MTASTSTTCASTSHRAPDAFDLTIDGADDVTEERGWVSPQYGVREEAPVISAVARGRDATFRTRVVAR